jgi:hypothetical protein
MHSTSSAEAFAVALTTDAHYRKAGFTAVLVWSRLSQDWVRFPHLDRIHRRADVLGLRTSHIDSANKDTVSFMKTVNLTIDEETWRAARRLAAERDTSVSALVREALEHLTKTSERRDEARREIKAMIGSFGGRVGVMPSREERNARRWGVALAIQFASSDRIAGCGHVTLAPMTIQQFYFVGH